MFPPSKINIYLDPVAKQSATIMPSSFNQFPRFLVLDDNNQEDCSYGGGFLLYNHFETIFCILFQNEVGVFSRRGGLWVQIPKQKSRSRALNPSALG